MPDLRQHADAAQRTALAVAQAVPAATDIAERYEALAVAEKQLIDASEAYDRMAGELQTIDRQIGRIESELGAQRDRLVVVEREVRTRAPQIETYDRRLAGLDAELDALPDIDRSRPSHTRASGLRSGWPTISASPRRSAASSSLPTRMPRSERSPR